MKKKSIIMHFVMLLVALVAVVLFVQPNHIQAAEIVASGTCGADGDNLTWTLDSEGTVIISGTGPMKDYEYSAFNPSPWYYTDSVKKVIICEGVTSIGDQAFYECFGLTSVSIPSSVTSIGMFAFTCCYDLTEVTIPEEGLTRIHDGAFLLCNIAEITIPNTLIYIGENALPEGGNLKYNEFDNARYLGNPQNPYLVLVESVSDAITSCVIHEDTKIINAGAFKACTELSSISIPDGVMSICRYAFRNCSGLTSITLPDSVTYIWEYAFEGCSSLSSIVIPDGVTDIEYGVFRNCSSLVSITIPGSITTIREYAFSECSGLREVRYKGTTKQWAAITIDEGNEPLLNADVVCEAVAVIPGDIDGNEAVTRDDVIQLLLHVTMPSAFPVDVPADFTGDVQVTRDDVIQLLLHVSMPDMFPLTI